MKIIGLIIAVVLYAVPFVLLEYFFRKEIKELKNDMWEVKYNRNHISRIEQGIIENGIRENKKLIEELVTSLEKKVEPIEQITHYSYGFDGEEEHSRVIGYKVVDLTDKEKTINELRKQADELERGDIEN